MLYFSARFAFGYNQLMGKRFISFAAGLISFAFGGIIAMFVWDGVRANMAVLPFCALPVSLLLLGLYVVPASIFVSNQRIEKLFKDIAG